MTKKIEKTDAQIYDECIEAFRISFGKNGECKEVSEIYIYCNLNSKIHIYQKAYRDYYD